MMQKLSNHSIFYSKIPLPQNSGIFYCTNYYNFSLNRLLFFYYLNQKHLYRIYPQPQLANEVDR
jgi:hypothetical protein